jgi:hypothetical protein
MNTIAKLIGFFLVIALIILAASVAGIIFTYLVIFIAKVLFNCDLMNKFWGIFATYYLYVLLFRTKYEFSK